MVENVLGVKNLKREHGKRRQLIIVSLRGKVSVTSKR